MLRLLRQPGVRVTTRSITQQHIQYISLGQYKGFSSGPTNEPKDKENLGSRPGDKNSFVSHRYISWIASASTDKLLG